MQTFFPSLFVLAIEEEPDPRRSAPTTLTFMDAGAPIQKREVNMYSLIPLSWSHSATAANRATTDATARVTAAEAQWVGNSQRRWHLQKKIRQDEDSVKTFKTCREYTLA